MESLKPYMDLQYLSLAYPNRDVPSEKAVALEQQSNHLLIVDDEPDVRAILTRYLSRLGYECAEADTGLKAIQRVQNGSYDIVITDIQMPQMNGIELLHAIKARDESTVVLMITANQDVADAISAMKLGADDYIIKPFDLRDVSRSVTRGLEKRMLKRQIRNYQEHLESVVARRTSQVQQLFLSIIQSLVGALEAKDRYTDGHSRRVAFWAMQLGKAAGLEPHEMELLQVAAVFHDLGKIGIRESVLMKEGVLTPEEYEHIKTHPDIGVRILQPLQELKEIFPIVRHHHERIDGTGYPAGIRGEKIPLGARILTVVDAFDAMTSARPYRSAMTVDEAISRLRKGAGCQFDPRLVKLFISLVEIGGAREFLEARLEQRNEDSRGTADDQGIDGSGSLMNCKNC